MLALYRCGPAGRGARLLPRGPPPARRGARDRAEPGAPGARARDPAPRRRERGERPAARGAGRLLGCGAARARRAARRRRARAAPGRARRGRRPSSPRSVAPRSSRQRVVAGGRGAHRLLHLDRAAAPISRASPPSRRRSCSSPTASARRSSPRRRATSPLVARHAGRSGRTGRCSSRSAAAARSGRRSSSAPGSPAHTGCRCACSASRPRDGQRDASRMLASASLALQRFAGDRAPRRRSSRPEPPASSASAGAAIVASLPAGELDADPPRARRAGHRCPCCFVHAGLRPGGLAPDRTLTRFSWSLAG